MPSADLPAMGIDTKIMMVGQKLAEIYLVLSTDSHLGTHIGFFTFLQLSQLRNVRRELNSSISTENNQKQVDVIKISVYAECKINVIFF